MKRTIHLILCMMFCAAPFFSLAQVTIEFTSFEVSNVSNRFYSSGGVCSVITATLRNTSDKPLILLLSDENVLLFFPIPSQSVRTAGLGSKCGRTAIIARR